MSGPIQADLLIAGATLLTMDAERRIVLDGALAIRGDRIVAVGKREALARTVQARETLEASRFVLTPGFVDAHIHITADPLTRGFRRGGPEVGWSERLTRWVIPLFRAQTPQDEAIAAQCAALAMLRYGTTTFVEAGSVTHLDAVVEALEPTGVRGRLGGWTEGFAYDPAADQAALSAEAVSALQAQAARWPDQKGEARLAAWPILVGHSTNSDDVWRGALALARDAGLRVSAHMSPRAGDPEWFLKRYGRRPLEHLADIGVLGPELMLTHLADIDDAELDLLVQSGTGAILCPHAALQGGFNLARKGRHAEMLERGVKLCMGTDGVAADVLSAARLTASFYRDVGDDQWRVPATAVLEMATVKPAAALGWSNLIGTLEVGRKADLVLYDTHLPDWGGPVFDPVEQLAFSAPPHGVHTVFVDGRKVLEAGRSTLLDEEAVLARAREAGRALVARTGLPSHSPWPVQ